MELPNTIAPEPTIDSLRIGFAVLVGVVDLTENVLTGRGGRQRLEKVGRRGLSKATAYVIEQRGGRVVAYHDGAPEVATQLVSSDPPFDEHHAFERISIALREMTSLVANGVGAASNANPRDVAAVD